MSVIQRYIAAVRGRSRKVVLPEGQDERVVRAARRMKDEGIAEPMVLGHSEQIAAGCAAAGVTLDGITTIDPATSDHVESYAKAYCLRRDVDLAVARRIVKRPLCFAGMMVATGDADTFVGGATVPTSLVITAGMLTLGPAPGIETASSYFLMILPELLGQKERPLIYADCGVNIAPTPPQLADIAIASERTARALLDEEPRVAMLSFSTKGSAVHPAVERVTKALAIARERAPGLTIDGEFQGDAALVPAVAAKKVKTPSAVAGRANVLIFPDLNAGNIAYKLTQYLAGAEAIGPLLQGFAKPISDLSRGASVHDIIAAAAICLMQAGPP